MKVTVSRALKTTLKMAAVAAFATAGVGAHAQSSVQLYGQVDSWAGMQQFPGGKRAWVVGGGGMSTSYWGMKGSEDLGGGYKADLHLGRLLPAAKRKLRPLLGDTLLRPQCLCRHRIAVRHGDRGPSDDASIRSRRSCSIRSSIRTRSRRWSITCFSATRQFRPARLMRPTPGGRRFGLEQRGPILDAEL